MAWSEETLGDASKKQLVQFLQKWCTPEFLKQHKLNGRVKAIVKKAKMPALREAYTTAMTTPKEHMTTEGYDEVRAMVSVEEESIEEEEKSSVDPKSQKMLQMVYKQREKIEAVFQEFDENNQGTVSDEEFAMAFELLGVNVEAPKIKQLIEECTDWGQVNFARFMASIKQGGGIDIASTSPAGKPLPPAISRPPPPGQARGGNSPPAASRPTPAGVAGGGSTTAVVPPPGCWEYFKKRLAEVERRERDVERREREVERKEAREKEMVQAKEHRAPEVPSAPPQSLSDLGPYHQPTKLLHPTNTRP
jgi:hypothetical protein